MVTSKELEDAIRAKISSVSSLVVSDVSGGCGQVRSGMQTERARRSRGGLTSALHYVTGVRCHHRQRSFRRVSIAVKNQI